MPDYNHIYNHQADQYQRLISYEDTQGNLLRALQAIQPLAGLDVVESGAGTGRLTCLLAPYVRSLRAFDLSPHMLAVAQARLAEAGQTQVQTAVADHRSLPLEAGCADLLISGWSFCYVALSGGPAWREGMARTLADYRRFVRPGGKIIIIETLGTGVEQPQRNPVLQDYLAYLDGDGFQLTALRTDFCFPDSETARELTAFFFGEEMVGKLQGLILPECTGIWQQTV